MQRSMSKRRIVSSAPIAAITLSSAAAAESMTRIGTWSIAYMRLVAAISLGEGLLQWSAMLVSQPDGNCAMFELPVEARVGVVFFAIIDLIAAVGLWLAAPWGGVIWLVATGAQFFVLLAMPGFFVHPLMIGSSSAVLLIGYLALTWLVARSESQRA
jgi:hypothetical protein